MPIKEYRCKDCGYINEILYLSSDDLLTCRRCAVCDKTDLVEVISLSSFRLKGNGWYETDYGKKRIN